MKQVLTFVAAIWIITLTGCAALDDLGHKGAFQDITKAYASSMRWSDFDTAVLFVKQPDLPSLETLNNIKITTYEVKHHLVIQEGVRIRQIASVAYFKKSNMLLRTISVEEIWELNAEDNQWYLTKGFPDFK
jgi:hypothetical protein